MDEEKVGVAVSKTVGRAEPAMRGAIVNDPEDTAVAAVRILLHDLLDAAVERYDAGVELATPEQLDAVDVKSGQVTPKPRSACTRARPSWASFLVGRDDELVVAQGGCLAK